MNIDQHSDEFSELGYTIVREFITPDTARVLKQMVL